MHILRSGLFALAVLAFQMRVAADEPALSGGTPKIQPPPGAAIFRETCAACHTAKGLVVEGRMTPSVDTLAQYGPEQVYRALATGKMRAQGASLSDLQKRQVATYVAHRPFVDVAGTDIKAMKSGRCARREPLQARGARWNGWGNGVDNARYQAAGAAGLKAEDIPHLNLKWAFGVPGATNMFSQPSVAWGRAFFGSDNAAVYAVSLESGCAYWSFHADGPVRAAPLTTSIRVQQRAVSAVVFTSTIGSVYAVDADRGKLLWQARVPGLSGSITGSPAYHKGRLYVPLTGGETVSGSNPDYECCKSRGAVVALDANTGAVLWRSESIPEKLTRIGTNERGTALFGPAGASVWNAPTIDEKRQLLYVGTGNNYGPRASATSDSVLALRLATGEHVWHHQEFANDSFMLGCKPVNPPGGNCPEKLGPDWDFGGSSVILRTLPDGRDVLLAAGKGGVAIALDPDREGKLLWRTPLYDKQPPTADGLVVFGGAADERHVYYPLQRPGGGLIALDLESGRALWHADLATDARGQVGPAAALPGGVVFTGAWDGVLRAVGGEGRVIWSFDTKRAFTTVNGVDAHGGSLGSAGPTIAAGRVLITSGYVGMQGGTGGNVVVAFGM